MNINIKSGRIIVTDPCYKRGTWCQGILENCKNGKWEVFASLKDYRVAELTIKHVSAKPSLKFDEEPFEVGVDSGQAGFFDESRFPNDNDEFKFEDPDEVSEPTTFYGKCCSCTVNNPQHGVVDGFGVVSPSGYGDGGYKCFTAKDDSGKIVAATIVFIGESDDS